MSKTQTKKSNVPNTEERTNMVFLAGIVQTANIEAERAFFTLDVGMKQWVPCSVYKNQEIIDRLGRLTKGDFVQLKAIIKPWSVKDTDNGKDAWKRGLNIEITEMKTIIKGTAQREESPDDLPF